MSKNQNYILTCILKYNPNKEKEYKTIHDLQTYLSNIRTSMENGSNIIGYSVWSLIDNYNWGTGYK